MNSSTTCLALCLALLVTAAAGIADAKAPDVNGPTTSGKKDTPPGQEKKDAPAPSLPGAQEPAPSPDPTPVPTAPPPAASEAVSTAAPTPAPVSSAPLVQDAPASSSRASPAPGPAEAEAPDVDAPVAEASSEAASEAEKTQDSSTETPAGDPLPFLLPRVPGAASSAPLGMSAAAPAGGASGGIGLWWGFPLAGLLLLGVVLSSARLVQPRPVTRERADAAPVGAFAEPAPPALAASEVPVSLVPRDLDSLLRAAKAAAEAERLDEAVLWLDRALRLAPALPVAHFCRGVCLAGLGRHEESYAALRRAHELDPTEGAYRLELARACGRVGRTGEAMDVLGLLLQAVPELVEDVATDPCFEGLRDHPLFLAMTGRL